MKNLTDDEKILIWLGYHSYERNDKTYYVDETRDMYVSVLCLDRERLFLTEVGDPELDLLVLMKIRQSLFRQRQKFLTELYSLWYDRTDGGQISFCDALLINYQPGDYARAARFLWHKN